MKGRDIYSKTESYVQAAAAELADRNLLAAGAALLALASFLAGAVVF